MPRPSYHNDDVFFEMILGDTKNGASQAKAVPFSDARTFDWQINTLEGQLAVDVLETRDQIVVLSTVAGAITDKIEVFVHEDLLTIRGVREAPEVIHEALQYFHQECFWGKFSRTIVLPTEVKGDMARAEYKNGILKVTIPKRQEHSKVPIVIVEE